MKQVPVLVLMMGVSAFAATLNVSIQAPGLPNDGGTATLDMTTVSSTEIQIVFAPPTDGAQLLGGNMLMMVSGDDILGVTSGTLGPDLYDAGTGEYVPDTMLGVEGYYISFVGPDICFTENLIAYTFEVVPTAVGTITIGLYPHNHTIPAYYGLYTWFGDEYTADFQGTTTPLTINVIPEPASLALLAIGGLAVIRRR